MRLTFPNPLGPPITLDTHHVTDLRSKIPTLPPQFQRRAHLRLLIILLFLIGLIIVRPTPPFPPNYSDEWEQENNLPWVKSSAKYPEGREGRYLK